jgi:hypothetical protein
MERAKSQVVGASPFQFYERSYHVHDINARLDLLYGVLCNQGSKDNAWGGAFADCRGMKEFTVFQLNKELLFLSPAW